VKKQRKQITKPICSMRLKVTSIDVYADDMLTVLERNFDLKNGKVLEQVRIWLRGQLAGFASHIEYDMAKGAALGMQEMGKLLANPEYGKLVQERRERLVRDRTAPELVRKVRQMRRKGKRQ